MKDKKAIRVLENIEYYLKTHTNESCEEEHMAITHAIKAIENEKPAGEWIVTAEDNEGIHRIQCPFCRYEKGSDFTDYITVTFERMPPFCENCGAELKYTMGGR